MTLEESKQIHYIIKEISVLQRELAELKMKNPYKQNIINDMPRGGGGTFSYTHLDVYKRQGTYGGTYPSGG